MMPTPSDPELTMIQTFKTIATIRTDFPSKFGVPRQSGLVDELVGTIVFEPEYRDREALRGIEEFSHLWLIWIFSENRNNEKFAPTVRPPRLGGNVRMGVWATRSPFRPNPIGLSCVRLDHVELDTDDGPVIVVRGADLVDGTPILDIKPYLPFAECHPDARGGFTRQTSMEKPLEVVMPDDFQQLWEPGQLAALRNILSQDPRPRYQNDPNRIYGMEFAARNIKFRVDEGRVFILSVTPDS